MHRTVYGIAAFIALGASSVAPASAQPMTAGGLAGLRQETAPRGDVQEVQYYRRRHHRGGIGLFLPGVSLYVGPRYRHRYRSYYPYYYDDYYYAPNYYSGGPYYYGGGYGRSHRYYRHGRGFRRH